MKDTIIIIMISFVITFGIIGGVYFFVDNMEEEPKQSVLVHDGFNDDEPIENVIEERTVVKHVYVNEEDFSSYSSTETGSSYWYVYYSYEGYEPKIEAWDGYRVVEIDVPYYDVNKVIRAIKPDISPDFMVSGGKAWLGVRFSQRVSFDTYQNYMKDKG